MEGTNGRVYGGDPTRIHIDDGKRADVGLRIAERLDNIMRCEYTGPRTLDERIMQPLCPGCYMIALVNAAITLADANGQSRTEMARTMRNAFHALMENPDKGMSEEIEIMLDPCDAK